MSSSIDKGNRVVVTGRLRIRDWTSGEKAGTTVEVDADAVGHDLAWGTAVYTRSVSARAASDGETAGATHEDATGAGDEADGASDSASASADDRVPIPF